MLEKVRNGIVSGGDHNKDEEEEAFSFSANKASRVLSLSFKLLASRSRKTKIR